MLSLLLAAALAAPGPNPLADAERAFLAFRDADDRARLKATRSRETRRRERVADALAALNRVSPAGLSDEDRRAVAAMRQALEPPRDGPDPLTRSVYAAYGRAAEAVAWEGETLDRSTILGRLASEPDAGRRKSLFAALAPVWASIAGSPRGPSPYAQLVAQRRTAWSQRAGGSPFARKAAEWGLTEEQLEGSLVRVLEAWRVAAVPATPIEPWDWYFESGAADRALASRLPRDATIALAIRYYRDLGASPDRLHVALDLKPRRGKDPVAFTDFVRHGRYEGAAWRDGRFRISAAYRSGGLGDLYELMHEMGHAVHIAAIRARPAFDDWPDSDVLTEALADMLGVEAYEVSWQALYVGGSADAATLRRARLAGSMLDVAWALFEMRVHRDPAVDPNAVWTEITSRYLGIAAHPELSWWAMRGQLVNAPGYMTNYALGAILTEALRARVRALRGDDAFETPSPELYRWLSERLYRFGLARPSRDVVEAFLGGPVTAEPLLAAIAAVRGGT
jgi:hypothetical protein